MTTPSSLAIAIEGVKVSEEWARDQRMMNTMVRAIKAGDMIARDFRSIAEEMNWRPAYAVYLALQSWNMLELEEQLIYELYRRTARVYQSEEKFEGIIAARHRAKIYALTTIIAKVYHGQINWEDDRGGGDGEDQDRLLSPQEAVYRIFRQFEEGTGDETLREEGESEDDALRATAERLLELPTMLIPDRVILLFSAIAALYWRG